MDISVIKSVSTIAFLVIIGLFAIISLLASYVFIRYGRTRQITIMISLVFGGLFVLGSLTALITLLNIF